MCLSHGSSDKGKEHFIRNLARENRRPFLRRLSFCLLSPEKEEKKFVCLTGIDETTTITENVWIHSWQVHKRPYPGISRHCKLLFSHGLLAAYIDFKNSFDIVKMNPEKDYWINRKPVYCYC